MADEREETPQTVYQAIAQVQRDLVVPKARFNKFGGFSYRNLEDITAALKEPCHRARLMYYLTDEVVEVGGAAYLKATATARLDDGSGDTVSAPGFARIPASKKGMDDSQLTGAASSYARKYALGGLFAIDGQSDADGIEQPARQEKQPPRGGEFYGKCRSCGKRYKFATPEQFEAWRANPVDANGKSCCAHPDYVVE